MIITTDTTIVYRTVGRPKKYERARRYLVTLDEELVERFDAILNMNDMNRSDTLNKMINEYVNAREEA